MSGSFVWVCICILDRGHFSFPDADADSRTIGLAFTKQFFIRFSIIHDKFVHLFISSVIRKVTIVTYKTPYDAKYHIWHTFIVGLSCSPFHTILFAPHHGYSQWLILSVTFFHQWHRMNDATVDSRYTLLNSDWWVNVKVARQPKSEKSQNKFNKLQAFTVFVFPTSLACAVPTSERQEPSPPLLHGRQTWPYWSKQVPSPLRHYCPPSSSTL